MWPDVDGDVVWLLSPALLSGTSNGHGGETSRCLKLRSIECLRRRLVASCVMRSQAESFLRVSHAISVTFGYLASAASFVCFALAEALPIYCHLVNFRVPCSVPRPRNLNQELIEEEGEEDKEKDIWALELAMTEF